MDRRWAIGLMIATCACGQAGPPRDLELYELRGAADGSTAEGGRVTKVGLARYEVTARAGDSAEELSSLAGGACAGQEMCSVVGTLDGRQVMTYDKAPPRGASKSFDCKAITDARPDCL